MEATKKGMSSNFHRLTTTYTDKHVCCELNDWRVVSFIYF